MTTAQRPRQVRTRAKAAAERATPIRITLPVGNDKSAASSKKQKEKPKWKEEDPDDESTLPIEEHFILRLPDNKSLINSFRESIQSREVPAGFKIIFKDSRNATTFINNEQYSAKLVDLPCIVESMKTFDNKQYYKIADISQMLLVSPTPQSAGPPPAAASKSTPYTHNPDEYIFPHGLTAPLQNVRKRRFRKRMVNHRAIENIEAEVERLLQADALAEETRYEIKKDGPGGSSSSDSDDDDLENSTVSGTAGDLQSVTARVDEKGTVMDLDEEGVDSDLDLAAEIDKGLEQIRAEGDGEESEDDSSDEDEDDDEEEDEEEEEEEEEEEGEEEDGEDESTTLQNDKAILLEEITDLEAKLKDKQDQIETVPNPILKKRFQDQQNQIEEKLSFKRSQVMDIEGKLRELGSRNESAVGG